MTERKPPIFQGRIHGRGGQVVVTGAEMLSVTAFIEDRHAQAFPSFGSERTGSPVVAFCRIADKEIRPREPILEPDCLIVQDPTLFKVIDVFAGLSGEAAGLGLDRSAIFVAFDRRAHDRRGAVLYFGGLASFALPSLGDIRGLFSISRSRE